MKLEAKSDAFLGAAKGMRDYGPEFAVTRQHLCKDKDGLTDSLYLRVLELESNVVKLEVQIYGSQDKPPEGQLNSRHIFDKDT